MLKIFSYSTTKGGICSGGFRIHNSKVGGSIPPPATNKINNLGGRYLPLFCYCGDFCVGTRLPLRKRFHLRASNPGRSRECNARMFECIDARESP